MVLPSSLPAQAASVIGSSRIAARFADIPKCNSFKDLTEAVLDLPRIKGNSHLGYGADLKRHPARGHWGSNGARAGPDIRRAWRGNVDRATPADQCQPRLVAGAMCLLVTFEN